MRNDYIILLGNNFYTINRPWSTIVTFRADILTIITKVAVGGPSWEGTGKFRKWSTTVGGSSTPFPPVKPDTSFSGGAGGGQQLSLFVRIS